MEPVLKSFDDKRLSKLKNKEVYKSLEILTRPLINCVAVDTSCIFKLGFRIHETVYVEIWRERSEDGALPRKHDDGNDSGGQGEKRRRAEPVT